MIKSYKFRIYPTKEQEVLIQKHFGCSRWVYNWALQQKIEFYQKENKSISIYELQSKLPQLKIQNETIWLADVSAQSLQSSLHNLDKGFTKFFNEKSGFPKFKSKHDNKKSFQVSQKTNIDFDKAKIYILKFKEGIKCIFSRQFEGKIKTTTVSQVPSGKYYVSILVETPEIEPQLSISEESKAIGLDFGIKDLIVLDDGTKIENPKTLNKYLKKLKKLSRAHSRKKKGSKNRDKARLRLAKLHEKISNIRTDYLQKVSTKLVRENQATTLCIEDLSVSSMLKDSNKNLARSIQDVGWYSLRQMLEYKCKWYGKNLKVIGRFEPSSKICSDCGYVKQDLTLADRNWTCICGKTHDRDQNAAINIKKFAFKEQNTSSKPKCNKISISKDKDKIPKDIGKFKPVDHCVSDGTKQEIR